MDSIIRALHDKLRGKENIKKNEQQTFLCLNFRCFIEYTAKRIRGPTKTGEPTLARYFICFFLVKVRKYTGSTVDKFLTC